MEIPEKWIEWLFKARDDVKQHIEKLDIQENIELYTSFARLDWYIESLELIKNVWK